MRISRSLYPRTLATVIIALIAWYSLSFADVNSGSGIDMSKMTPKEVLEFYKKNPDYGKKRIWIDYQKYIEGEWVVMRGEYADKKTWEPIKNTLVKIVVNGKEYKSVTNDKGVFNLETKKKDFLDGQLYKITVAIDHYKITATYSGKKIKEDSIYHFRINKEFKWGEDFFLELQTIHNAFFKEGTVWFEYQENVRRIPSILGIQWAPLLLTLILSGLFLAFLYFKYRQTSVRPMDFEKNANKNIIPFD